MITKLNGELSADERVRTNVVIMRRMYSTKRSAWQIKKRAAHSARSRSRSSTVEVVSHCIATDNSPISYVSISSFRNFEFSISSQFCTLASLLTPLLRDRCDKGGNLDPPFIWSVIAAMAQPYDFISKIVSLGDSGSGKSM
jgi:hypothetical protein